MISGESESRGVLSLGWNRGNKGENHTEWDLELRRKLNWLADLNYAILSHVIQEALKVEDENGWKRLDEYLLARLVEAKRTEPHGLQVRDAGESVLYSVH